MDEDLEAALFQDEWDGSQAGDEFEELDDDFVLQAGKVRREGSRCVGVYYAPLLCSLPPSVRPRVSTALTLLFRFDTTNQPPPPGVRGGGGGRGRERRGLRL